MQEQRKDRHTEEVEAESISYAVCKYFGIETGENSFGYIASWSQGKELKELREMCIRDSHVGIVIGTDGSRVYTVEGNSGDACKIKSYDLNYQSIKGYGLMNW